MKSGDIALVALLAFLALFAVTAKTRCAPLFVFSVVGVGSSQPVTVGFSPMKVRARLRFNGQLTSGSVCFVVQGPESHQSCIESERPFPPVVTRDFTLRGAGTFQLFARVGNVQSNTVQVELGDSR